MSCCMKGKFGNHTVGVDIIFQFRPLCVSAAGVSEIIFSYAFVYMVCGGEYLNLRLEGFDLYE